MPIDCTEQGHIDDIIGLLDRFKEHRKRKHNPETVVEDLKLFFSDVVLKKKKKKEEEKNKVFNVKVNDGIMTGNVLQLFSYFVFCAFAFDIVSPQTIMK